MSILRPVKLIPEGPKPAAASLSVTFATDTPGLPVNLAGNQTPLGILEPGTGIVLGTIGANGQRVAAAMTQRNGASIFVSGTYAGVNLAFEASYNDGASYLAVQAVAINGNTVVTSTGALSNALAAYEVYCPGATHVAVRATSWTSGSMAVRIAPYAIACDPNVIVSGVLNGNQAVNNTQWGGSNALNGGVNGSVGIGGLAADSAASSGNPVQTGGRVRTAIETSLAANDAMALTGTTGMQLLVKPYGLPETDWQYSGLIVSNTAAAVRAAGAASVRTYVTALQYQNTSATVSEIQLQDGSTVIWRGQAGASMVTPAIVIWPTPLRGTAATALHVQLLTAGTNTLVNVQGYQAI